MTNIETTLREANRLLAEIDDNPLHPANDSRHKDHASCVKAYEELHAWTTGHMEEIAKKRAMIEMRLRLCQF